MKIIVHKQILTRLDAILPGEAILLDMPKGMRVIHVGTQGSNIVIWYEARIDLLKEVYGKVFLVVPTGFEFDDGTVDDGYFTHIGTVAFYDGNLIYHVYEEH